MTAPLDPPPSAWLLDGRGGGHALDRDALAGPRGREGPVWIDLDEGDQAARAWLLGEAGLGREDGERFLRQSAWPRVVEPHPERLLVYMRVPDPERSVASGVFVLLRLWFEPGRAISMCLREIPEFAELKRRLAQGRGPRTIGEILLAQVELTALRMSEAVVPLRVALGDLDAALEEGAEFPMERFARLRRHALGYERYVDPHGDLLLRLRGLELPWLEAPDGERRWHTAVDFFGTMMKEVDAIVDHARALQDSLAHRTSEQINRRILVLTVVSTILLPLSLITGLFGSNIGTRGGNVAGAASPLWFVALVVFLGLVGLAVFLFLRYRRLL